MPYQAGKRLPGEKASKLGHLEVLQSELVNRLCRSFEEEGLPETPPGVTWIKMPIVGEPLSLVFGVDGSVQPIESPTPPHKAIAFVKTALLRIDEHAIAKVDKVSPHPFALRDILEDAALYHATVFPLRHVRVPEMSLYDAIRQVIYESMQDASLDGELLETLKWIAYEKWSGTTKSLEKFECPHCQEDVATLPYNEEKGFCPGCGGEIFVTDMLGFHLEMAPESAPDSIATNYMRIHETLLLFTGIRYFWENNKPLLSNSLFCSDGPLSIRAQYSKLVAPIRRFLAFAHGQGHSVHIIGQEKTGRFVEHLELIGDHAPSSSVFIPADRYIKEEIQHRPDTGAPYGKDTNYGAKVFVKMNDYHRMVLNIPTISSRYITDPTLADLLGVERIFATLPKILSHRHESALIPIELANGVASLSTYPSARILSIFANSQAHKEDE
jgi:hypothetical protein